MWGHKFKANLPSSTRALFSDKAHCFSQSECALYGNFIIIIHMNEWMNWRDCLNLASSLGLYYFCGHLSIQTVPLCWEIGDSPWDNLELNTWVPVLTASQIHACQRILTTLTYWLPTRFAKMKERFLVILAVFRLEFGQISYNLVENALATLHVRLAVLATSIAFYDILAGACSELRILRKWLMSLGF